MSVHKPNVLIAKFMGMTHDDNDESVMIQGTPQGNEVVPIDSMEYHTSWDWLIPVVHRIEFLCQGVPVQLFDVSLYSEITEVYNSVFDFLETSTIVKGGDDVSA